MLDLNAENVCYLIDKARQFHVKEAVTITEAPTSPSDDWARQVLADHQDDFSYQELVAAINDLDPGQQVQLVALMWLGRGDFEKSEWHEAVKVAADSWTDRTADYLIATPLVADYLSEGLYLFGRSCD
ncbi:MAG: DUF3775 domain-containing protein [Gammaproteobacteria bacterium]|nr:DUF3775 domain-containing protein [Gammaproteobacteria bacterium]